MSVNDIPKIISVRKAAKYYWEDILTKVFE